MKTLSLRVARNSEVGLEPEGDRGDDSWRKGDRERRGITKGVQASELIYVREGASLNAIRRLWSCTTAIARSVHPRSKVADCHVT
jgi:hypothetical protein